nr:uncharacterized protein LOC108947330 [Nicotiana tomentosiformis]
MKLLKTTSRVVTQLPLIAPVTREELYLTLKDISDLKSPGCDGFNACLFKKAWSIIGDDVSDAAFHIFQTTWMYNAINCTTVTLIHKVESHVVVLEDKDVVKAIVEYVNRTGVEALILGAATSGGFLRFKAKDIPGGVLKGVPDFCTIHIISKYGKIASTRSASRPPPFVHPPPYHFADLLIQEVGQEIKMWRKLRENFNK